MNQAGHTVPEVFCRNGSTCSCRRILTTSSGDITRLHGTVSMTMRSENGLESLSYRTPLDSLYTEDHGTET